MGSTNVKIEYYVIQQDTAAEVEQKRGVFQDVFPDGWGNDESFE